jgi:cell division protein FtsB
MSPKRWIPYLAALALLAAVSAVHPGGLRKHARLAEEAARVARDTESLRQEVARLRREARALNGDPAALERAAREELGYVRPGEVVYHLSPRGSRP